MTEAQATSLLDKLWANLHEDRGSNPRGRGANFFAPGAYMTRARICAREDGACRARAVSSSSIRVFSTRKGDSELIFHPISCLFC